MLKKIVLTLGLILLGLAALTVMGGNRIAEDAGELFKQNPVVLEHLGGVQAVELDFMATVNAETRETRVLRVFGPKGKGEVVAEFSTTGDKIDGLVSGRLILESGAEHDLLP
ncbi:MAG: hypothetical protein DHS20C15_27310 [Planctomycetota bacterium]|nr:MAG: hypothetical protein DHS20C15_27310 [Planctomycetota bacterium]